MYDPSFSKYDKDTITDTLESVCYDVVEESYTKQLSETELTDKKTELAEVSIELSKLDKEKKELNDQIKSKIDPKKKTHGELLEAIHHRSQDTYGKLYLVDDQDTNTMYYFDENGVCVKSRAMHREERQIKLKSIKTGTDE
ncbi:hypothetical protein [Aquimarina macrocephali]|uniref:hypothetical protein n=1 Tax=Aquimarina macrocephali TaxID=666563 RepID=UPI003F6769DF